MAEPRCICRCRLGRRPGGRCALGQYGGDGGRSTHVFGNVPPAGRCCAVPGLYASSRCAGRLCDQRSPGVEPLMTANTAWRRGWFYFSHQRSFASVTTSLQWPPGSVFRSCLRTHRKCLPAATKIALPSSGLASFTLLSVHTSQNGAAISAFRFYKAAAQLDLDSFLVIFNKTFVLLARPSLCQTFDPFS